MHKFSTASPKSLVLTVLHSVGLLSVPYSTLAGASDPQAGAPAPCQAGAFAALRDENLCIIRARVIIRSLWAADKLAVACLFFFFFSLPFLWGRGRLHRVNGNLNLRRA
jgi:hypothetical protein